MLEVFEGGAPEIVERWTGTYASATDRLMLMDRPSDALRIVLITSGTGRQHVVRHRRGNDRRPVRLNAGPRMRHLKAVIFDWAGTVVDYGSLAPMGAFVETFAQFGVEITIDEARGPMGMAKRPHIVALTELPRVAEAWKAAHGRLPSEADVDALYEVFVPKNIEVAGDYADLIPGRRRDGARRCAPQGSRSALRPATRARSWRAITPKAAAQGFAPDSLVCTGDTPDGRPSPLMFYKGLIDMNVWPAWAAIKVDDTTVGVAEGLNAGAWAVGVAVSGNAFGLSLADTKALSPQALRSEAGQGARDVDRGRRALRDRFRRRSRPVASRDRRPARARRAAVNSEPTGQSRQPCPAPASRRARRSRRLPAPEENVWRRAA